MDQYSRHKDFYDRPIRLSESEMANPGQILESFCGAHHLHELRQQLWLMVESALTSGHPAYEEARSRENLLSFYVQLEEMLEALYIKSWAEIGKKWPKIGQDWVE